MTRKKAMKAQGPYIVAPLAILNDLHKDILDVLRLSDLLGSGDIARRLKKRQAEVLAHLAFLEGVGAVVHDRKGGWRLHGS